MLVDQYHMLVPCHVVELQDDGMDKTQVVSLWRSVPSRRDRSYTMEYAILGSTP